MEEVDLKMIELIYSTEIMEMYKKLRGLWSKEFTIELIRIHKSLDYLKEDLESLRDEVAQVKVRLNRPERDLAWA